MKILHPMRSISFASFIACCLGWFFSDTAAGQMFGQRSLGTPLTRQASPGTDGSVGTLRNQRFIRGNRSRRDFVGIDRIDTNNFVGIQTIGAAQIPQSAVTTTPQPSTQGPALNAPLPAVGRDQMYPPKIVLDFDYQTPSQALRAAELTENLRSLSEGIEVSVAGRTAILRGEVPSADHARLATIMASFQPGISEIVNELKIVGDSEGTFQPNDPGQVPPPPIPEPVPSRPPSVPNP